MPTESPTPAVTNDQIDTWLLDRIRREKKEYPEDKITNLGLGFALLHHFREKLSRTDSQHWQEKDDLNNAKKVANYACQRLRRAGKITFSKTGKWEPVQPK